MNQLEHAAEKTMEMVWHHHDVGDFDASIELLKSFDYTEESINFTLDPDSYYFPNHRNGDLVRPAGISEDKIPIVALESGRTYQFERPPLHRLQRLALIGAGVTYEDLHLVSNDFQTADTTIAASTGPQGAASVYCHLSNTLAGYRSVASRPTLIFNSNIFEPVPETFCPGVALHELVHVAQTLTNPTYDKSNELRKELEAYAVQAKLVGCFTVEYSMGTAMAGTVEAFRRRHLGVSEFEPTEYFIHELRKDSIVSKIWNSIHD